MAFELKALVQCQLKDQIWLIPAKIQSGLMDKGVGSVPLSVEGKASGT